MQTTVKLKSALDSEVKTINSLLQQLSIDDRIEYIKNMISGLLSMPQQITSSSQRLAEKHMTPFNNLSSVQRDLIADISKKTEALHKLTNEI